MEFDINENVEQEDPGENNDLLAATPGPTAEHIQIARGLISRLNSLLSTGGENADRQGACRLSFFYIKTLSPNSLPETMAEDGLLHFGWCTAIH